MNITKFKRLGLDRKFSPINFMKGEKIWQGKEWYLLIFGQMKK